MARSTYFTPQVFRFLEDLAVNNNREWFHANKPRYEEQVRDPAVRFISDFGPRLRKISPEFRADPRPVGGSLFRIHRDTRFARDKSPYKTYTGIQFRHARGRDAHCPGFYLHLQPKSVFVGVGIWHPDGPTLKKIREAILEDPAGWKRASRGKKLTERFELAGDRLVRPPRGIDPEHTWIEDLKRKDFIAVARVPDSRVTAPEWPAEFHELCRTGAPLVRFLCSAIGVPF